MEYFIIYLLQIIDIIEGMNILSIVAFTVLAFGGIVLGFLTSFKFDALDDNEHSRTGELYTSTANFATKFVKRWLVISAIIALITGFLPTKQTLLLVTGVYYGKQVVKSEKMQKINEIIDMQLDKVLKDLKQEIKNTTP